MKKRILVLTFIGDTLSVMSEYGCKIVESPMPYPNQSHLADFVQQVTTQPCVGKYQGKSHACSCLSFLDECRKSALAYLVNLIGV